MEEPEEALVSRPTVSFTTRSVAPPIVGAPSTSLVTFDSALLEGEVNPENAKTKYWFEYASGKEALAQCPTPIDECPSGVTPACGGVMRTPMGESGVYGLVGATLEATGLQPDTEYSYRLCAESENSAGTEKLRTIGPEGHFKTLPAPSPSAQTGPASSVGTTSATVSGDVDPDGASATYAFELGVYAGANTQFGVVASGSTGASTSPVTETLDLNGLQPGTTYAYRIAISSGYGDSVGAPVTFTTAGLPSALSVPSPLAMLPLPSIAFPKPATKPSKCKHGYTRSKQGKCVKAKPKKKAQAKKAHKSRR